ncbi:MAG: SIS domain-containing protein [Inquilinaceae bacterium]
MNETMRREIVGQPDLLTRLLPALRAAVEGLTLSTGRIFSGGCGDSAFAAGAAAGLFAAAGIDYRPASAMDLAFHAPLAPGDLVVLMSISGGTRRTVQAARRSRAAGARTLAVTCNAESPLARTCDQCLILPFTPLSRRTPHTADYLATLLALAVLAERCGGRRNDALDRLPDVLAEVVDRTGAGAAALVRAAPSAAGVAKLFILGQGPNLATAHYIAAKFHEAGGLAGLAGETENFVHGMNFMVEPQDVVCVIGGDGPGAFRAAELLPGLTGLCRQVVAIGGDGEPLDDVITLAWPSLRSSLSVFPAAVIGQVLCLAWATAFRLDVEAPRAGRPGGDLHMNVQRAWMTQTPDGSTP